MSAASADTILLTGLPRAGTTLACAMLNEHPDTVALAEPMLIDAHGDRLRAVRDIDAFVHQARQQLLATRQAVTKHLDGVVPDNTVMAAPDSLSLRHGTDQHGLVTFDKPLTPAFRLIVKHPAFFTALVDLLVKKYQVYAVVRHPLAVLASWQTVAMAVNQGRLPMAEAFCPSLALRLDSIAGVLDRQVAILEWMLTTYLALPAGHLLRYEDMLARPASTLAPLSGSVWPAGRARQPHVASSRYAGVDLHRLAAALVPLTPVAARCYPDFGASLATYLSPANEPVPGPDAVPPR